MAPVLGEEAFTLEVSRMQKNQHGDVRDKLSNKPPDARRADSADSRILMPPPPLPSEKNQEYPKRETRPLGQANESRVADDQRSKLEGRATKATVPGGILLRDDGTWERVLPKFRGSLPTEQDYQRCDAEFGLTKEAEALQLRSHR